MALDLDIVRGWISFEDGSGCGPWPWKKTLRKTGGKPPGRPRGGPDESPALDQKESPSKSHDEDVSSNYTIFNVVTSHVSRAAKLNTTKKHYKFYCSCLLQDHFFFYHFNFVFWIQIWVFLALNWILSVDDMSIDNIISVENIFLKSIFGNSM